MGRRRPVRKRGRLSQGLMPAAVTCSASDGSTPVTRTATVSVARAATARTVAFVLVALMTVPMSAHAQPADSDESRPSVIERAVSFDVVNHNRSVTAPLCDGDGATYTIRGSLVGPAGVQAGQFDAVTLYLHGSGDASTWHFTAVPGVDHITEMARLGHASVFIHFPGYGPSEAVDGEELCLGTFADHAQQVVAQLRDGSYTMAGGPSPAFERVALAGHSSGGAIAQLATNSFHDADALIVAGWVDYPHPPQLTGEPDSPLFGQSAVAGMTLRCLTEPESKQPDGPGGWAYLFSTPGEFDMLVANIEPDVMAAFVAAYEQDPCGWGRDFDWTTRFNIALAPTVDIPVLLTNGDRDPVAPPLQVEAMRARYELGSDDVSSLIIPQTAHQIMLERNAAAYRSGLSVWLAARGF